ncbi:MAG: hypothetical protein O7E54_11225 [Planctomycetota bacterium]|nr:hypothetical protein [Planctomycetota bacterium]
MGHSEQGSRFVPAALLFLVFAGCGAEEGSSLGRAAKWLWSQQAADGGWHSETYGLLESGQALTPFVLHALMNVPESVCHRPPDGVDLALDFIRNHTNEEGILGVADPDLLEYPNYATSFALMCLVRNNDTDDFERVLLMRKYLMSQQYGVGSGFARGGWGLGGRRSDGSPGHMDLSYTRHVLDALRVSGLKLDIAVYMEAQKLLDLLQRRTTSQPLAKATVTAKPPLVDGGFYFSPIVVDANKGGFTEEGYYRSYATPTCDGLLALLAVGLPETDERVKDALAWLERHPRLDYPQGIPANQPIDWRTAIHYYHLAVRAEVYGRLKWPGDWRTRLADLLRPRQRDDGSFANEAHLMKEDDPFIATTLAVIALSHALPSSS